MSSIRLQSNAKVNLALDILGSETSKGPFEDYHFIQTVLHEITPENAHDFKPDFITIEAKPTKSSPSSIEIKCSDPAVPTDETSQVHKAAELTLKHAKTSETITITIEKNIPLASGLGGAASNTATVIKGLNHLLDLGIPPSEMRILAAEIGMDAPFFIRGGIALCEHYGEQITQLPEVRGTAFTLFPSPESTPTTNKTASQYAALDLKKCGKNTQKTEQLIHAIKTNDPLSIHENLHNDFETLLSQPLSENHHLTGSGPVQFLMV